MSATGSATNPTKFDYSHHTAAGASPINPLCFTPAVLGGMNSLTCVDVYGLKTCPPIYTSGKSVIKFDIAQLQNKLDSAKVIIDNGNNVALLNSIATKSPGQIKNDLLAKSPYLSDVVLTAAINKGLPPGILKDILIPNSPLTNGVKVTLASISLPNGILNQINNAAQTGVSARATLYNYISYIAGEKQNRINALIRYFLNDTTITTGLDSVKQIFITNDLPEVHCDLTKCYLTKNDMANATTSLDYCRTSGECPSFVNYMDVFMALKNSNADYTAIATDLVLLNKISLVAADANARESASADELVKEFQNTKFEEWIEPNEFSSNHRSMMINNQEQQSVVSVNHSLVVYPNPATEQVTVLINLPEDEAEASLKLYDITGRLVETFAFKGDGALQINTSNYSKGIYLCLLCVNGQPIDQVKLAVIK